MSTKDQILEVEQVIFESGDPEVSVKGTIQQGFLSYPTELLINSTQLNVILNQLQRNNTGIDIYEKIESVIMEAGVTLYRGLFGDLENTNIDLMFIEDIESIREIRA